jgi:hypothetical protein
VRSQTDDRTELDVDLDTHPKCRAKNCSRPAEYFLKSHGCMAVIACTKHTWKTVNYLMEGISLLGYLKCSQCGKYFYSTEQYTTVIPI